MSKKSTVLFNVALISTLGLGAGCNLSKDDVQKKLSTSYAEKLVKDGKGDEAAETYSRIGEILLSKPEGIVHAQTMFQKSLDLNINDNKANIYSALLSPLLSFKGFETRFGKIAEVDGTPGKISNLEAQVRATGVKEYIDFVLVMPEGAKPAKNAEDVRKFVRNEYVKELGKSLVKLDNIRSDRFTLNLDTSSYERKKSTVVTCHVTEQDVYECEETVSAMRNANVTIDAYDVKALKVSLKTQKNALTIASSVRLDGLKFVGDRFKNGTIKTDKEAVEAIKSQPNFLKIDGTKDDLREIFSHTEEIMNDLIDFSKISKTVCLSEERKSNLLNEICVSEKSAEKMSEALMFVVGPKSVVLGLDQNGREVEVEVNLRGLIDSKVTSLQELLPVKFDASGKVTEPKDLTFAGIIPNGDLLEKIKMVVKTHEQI